MAVILCVGTNELSATSMQFITTEFFCDFIFHVCLHVYFQV